MPFTTLSEVGARCVNIHQADMNCDQVNLQRLSFTTVCDYLSQDNALSILTHELHLSCSSTTLQEKAIVKQSRRLRRACSISQSNAYHGSLQEKGRLNDPFKFTNLPFELRKQTLEELVDMANPRDIAIKFTEGKGC
jgi:hypothetical protein